MWSWIVQHRSVAGHSPSASFRDAGEFDRPASKREQKSSATTSGYCGVEVTQNVYGKSWWEECVDKVSAAFDLFMTTTEPEREHEAIAGGAGQSRNVVHAVSGFGNNLLDGCLDVYEYQSQPTKMLSCRGQRDGTVIGRIVESPLRVPARVCSRNGILEQKPRYSQLFVDEGCCSL